MRHSIKLGVLLVLTSAFFYAIVAAIVKYTAANISTPVVVFIQIMISLILMSAWLATQSKHKKQQIIQSSNKRLHFIRACSSLGLGYLLYYSLNTIPLVNAMLLVNLAPLLVPLLGAAFFAKKINHGVWLPMLIGVVGVALVLHPSQAGFHSGSLYALLAAICMATSFVLTRQVAERGDSGMTTVFYYFLFATLISGIVSIPFWHKADETVYVMIALSGVLFFITQYTVTVSVQYIEASLVSTLYYANVVFAALITIVIFHHYPTLFTWLGLLLIVASGVFMVQVQRITLKMARSI